MTQPRPGPDHSLYRHSPFPTRPTLRWPGGERLAFAVFLYLEHWELSPPPESVYDRRHESLLGAVFPNYKIHSQYEYGNRVGIFRVLEALGKYNWPITIAANASACLHYPALVRHLVQAGCEFAAHGWSATRMLSSAMTAEVEARAIAESMDAVAQATGRRPVGWIGQDYGESTHTLDLLANAGIEYVADWANDDQPYFMNTRPTLVSIPNQCEWDDVQLVWHRKVHPSAHCESMCEAFDRLHEEGAKTAMFFGLHIHPWLSGAPHRICYLESALERLATKSEVWHAAAGQIATHVRASSVAAS